MFSSKIKLATFMDFYTLYKCVGCDIVDKMRVSALCFSRVFHSGNKGRFQNTYTIKILKQPYSKEIVKNNFCVLSKKDIIYFLQDAATYGFYTKPIIKLDEHKTNYIITMQIDDTPFAHRFLLSYVRYLYEAPYNMYLYETLRVKEECEVFKNESIFNLFHLIMSSNKFTDCFYTSCHSINCANFIKLYSYNDIIKGFHKKDAGSFTDVFKCVYDFTPKKVIYEKANHKNDYIKYFALKRYRNKRIKVYIENYNKLKELK